MASSSSSNGYSLGSAEADQSAMFTLTCETGFIAVPLGQGEGEGTPIRVICTLVTMSVASAWVSRRKDIGPKLLLFFTHWLSGLVYQLGLMVEATMISVCWTSEDLIGFLKFLKFVELTASNLLAVTNLAICFNLAQIVMSHRTLSTIKKANPAIMALVYLIVSVAAAATSAPFWETTTVTPTIFWPTNFNEGAQTWITIAFFYVEFFVGVCMLFIVVWLLIFWMPEIKECWKTHVRIRYYFVLTLIGTAVNLALGICGSIHAATGRSKPYLLVATWCFRYFHIALDTLVLYGVLGTSCIDERTTSSHSSSSEVPRTGTKSSSKGATITVEAPRATDV